MSVGRIICQWIKIFYELVDDDMGRIFPMKEGNNSLVCSEGGRDKIG